jgi:hypothetical protein
VNPDDAASRFLDAIGAVVSQFPERESFFAEVAGVKNFLIEI